MATRDIRPSTAITVCDVCGRTLLRGEHADVYIDGGARRSVCDLCKPRALHEGWVREGTVPTYEGDERPSARRGSFLTRLRRRRERSARTAEPPPAEPEYAGEYEPEPRADEPEVPRPVAAEPTPDPRKRAREIAREARRRAQESAPKAGRRDQQSGREARRRERASTREPRHVRAVPVDANQKIASGIELFNNSEHRRTVAGVARSLGAPTISIHPNDEHQSVVEIVASWELCWYRYEVDLSDEVPVVRVAAQGYELDELTPREREPNASYDEQGALVPA